MIDTPDAEILGELAGATSLEGRRAIIARTGLSIRDLLEEAARRGALLDRHDHTAALRLADLALSACPPELDPWGHGRALRLQASCVLPRQPARALDLLERAEVLFLNADDLGQAAQARMGQVGALNELGRQQEALERARTARHAFRRLGLDAPHGKLLANLALLAIRMGRLADALRLLARSRRLLGRAGEIIAVLQVDRERAAVFEELGRIGQARRLYRRAIHGYQRAGLRAAQAETEANLAALATAVGSPAEALRLLLSARTFFQQEDDGYALGLVSSDLADCYRRLNLHTEALVYAETAVALLQELAVDYDSARAHQTLAQVAAASGERARAMAALESAMALYAAAGAGLEGLDCRLVRAGLADDDAGRQTALSDLDSLEAEFLAAASPARVAAARLVRARLTEAQGDREEALRHLQVAEQQTRTLGIPALRAEYLRQHGALVRDEDPEQARRLLSEALTLTERVRRDLQGEDLRVAFLDDKQRLYEDLAILHLREDTDDGRAAAFSLVEQAKSRTLLDRVLGDPGVQRQRIADPGLRRRLEALREEIAWLQLQLGRSGVERGVSGTDTLRTRLQATEGRYEALVRETQAAQPAAAAWAWETAIRADDVHTMLGPDTALAEFFAIDGHFAVFVLDAAGLRVCRLEAREEPVRTAIERLAFHLEKFRYPRPYLQRTLDQLQRAARHYLEGLYATLVAPWYESVAATRLVIVPHGMLHGLPFHALHDGISHLIEDRMITYSPSAAVLQHVLCRGSRAATGRPLLVGLPHVDVPHVAREVGLLAAMLPRARALTGACATRDRVCKAMRGSSLIHIASHGVFRPENPLFSGVWLADGWLTGQDLYSTPLQADLVTLSACETGMQRVQSGDDLFGLVRAFLHAGAGSVISSLWPVHDRATSTLMGTLYQGLLAGQSRSQALRTAQIAGLRAGLHPYYWAPFMLVGDYR